MANKEWEDLNRRLEFSERRRAILQKRLSKGSIEEDSTLWSFVDLMTLLLILFILFYSHAMTQKASADIPPNPQTIAAQAPLKEITPKAPEPVVHNQSAPLREPSEIVAENQDESLEQFKEQVMKTVSEENQDDFSIRWNQKRLVMVLGERIAFNVGEAKLLSDFQPTLRRIAGFISSRKDYRVAVAGHTDDAPINTARFPSNWELSAIRAVNVAKFMIASGVDPHRVSIEGYSAYRPLQANTTANNKRANRRVEITLIKEAENSEALETAVDNTGIDESTKPANTAGHSAYRDSKSQAVSDFSSFDDLP